MRIADTDILILPGVQVCGPDHWQRRWGTRLRTSSFVERPAPPTADLASWALAIEQAVHAATKPVVFIAHSLAVPALVHAAPKLKNTLARGAFLVAPPDLENPHAPVEFGLFDPVPREPLPFLSMLVASNDDPLCSTERAAEFAACWGSDFHLAGDAGHIDSASGHGPWPEGLLMFTRLMQRIRD